VTAKKLDVNEVVLKIGHKVEDLATDQDRIPFRSGDLRKSIQTTLVGKGVATVGSNLPYARAVHDGRPAITIVPNVRKNPPYGYRRHKNPKKAALKFKVGGQTMFRKKVRQGPRKGKPFLREAVEELQKQGYDWLLEDLARKYGKELIKDLPEKIHLDMDF